jgi:hypothetical protein
MKSIIFGLAMLCVLPGCCGMWKCNKDEACESNGTRSKKEMREDRKVRNDMKDQSYKK